MENLHYLINVHPVSIFANSKKNDLNLSEAELLNFLNAKSITVPSQMALSPAATYNSCHYNQ